MKNGFDEKVKGHGFFRKTKAFGLASGIALGAALLIGANTVSADEATPAQPTTTAQPTNSDTKTEVVTVKEAELKAKVDEAKKAGVEVVEKPAVSVGTATNDADAKKLEAEATKKVDAEIKALDDAKTKVSNQSSQLNEAKTSILTEIKDKVSAYSLYNNLSTAQIKDNFDYSIGNVKNFKSSLGSPVFLKTDETLKINSADDQSEASARKLSRNTASSPTVVQYFRSLANFNNSTPENQAYANKRDNKINEVYVLSLRPGETVEWDVEFPKGSVLFDKYGINKVHKSVTLDKNAVLPPQVVAFEIVTPYIANDFEPGVIDDSSASRSAGNKYKFDYALSFKDKDNKDINLTDLLRKDINQKVFYGEEVIKNSDLSAVNLALDEHFPDFQGSTAKYSDLWAYEKDNVYKQSVGINPLPGNAYSYVPSTRTGKEYTTKVAPNALKNASVKVEVSPVTYTRATAITTTYVPNDKLNPGETKIIDDGKQSGKKVIEVGIKPSEKVEETPFKEETRPNPALPEGERKVVQEGVKGRKVTRTTYTLDTKTGKVTPKEEVTENSAPKNRIVEVGTKKPDSVTEGELVTIYRPNDKLEAGKQNEVDPGKKSKLVNGKETEAGKPRIVEVGTKPVVVEKEIPFKETVVQNPSKPEGTRTVLKEGKVGKETTTTTYTLDTKTGKVTPDTKTTVVRAEDRLVEVGTGKNVTGDVETQYVPDPELEPGKTKVVQNGTPEVKDVTGKVVTPGKPTIIHVGTKPKVVEEEIPFKEETRENKDLPKGQTKVVQEGKNGKKTTTTTYEVDPKTGTVTPTEKVEETPAVNKITEIGTKEEAKPTPTPASQTPAKPQVQEVKKQLPSTGSATSVALTLAGLSVMGLATAMVLKKKEQ